MKKSLLFAGALAMGLSAMAQNPYAYNASTGAINAADGTVPVNYTLNAAAERVVVDLLLNGEVVKSVEVDETALTAGEHAVNVSLEGLEDGTYDVAIRVKGAAVAEPQFKLMDIYWSPYGIAVDNNPLSPHFGRMLVTECQPSVNTSASYFTSLASETGVGVGIYEYDPQLNRVANPDGKFGYAVPWTQENYAYADYAGGTGSNFALKKVRISKDGRIFAGGLDIKNGQALCEINPDDLSQWAPVFLGEQSKYEDTGYDCNLYDENGEFVAGYSAAFAVTGEGEDLKITNLSSTRGQAFAYGSYKMYEYPLGTATQWGAPADEMDEVIPLSGQYTISAQSVSIDYDVNGNLWYAQYRGEPTEAQPSLKHASKNADGEWEEDYSDVSFICRGGGIACSPDGSKIAFSHGNICNLHIYNVTYDEFGTPTLELDAEIETPSGNHAGIRGFNDIAWDYAGNLYACDNGWETLMCIQPASEGNEVTTPLQAAYAVTIAAPEMRTISGVVYNNEQAPIAGVTVTATAVTETPEGLLRAEGEAAYTTVTDDNGAYSIEVPADAHYTLTFSKEGYKVVAVDEDQAQAVELEPDVDTGVSSIAAAETVVSVTYYNAAGAASDKPFDGVNIVVTKFANGSQSMTKVVK